MTGDRAGHYQTQGPRSGWKIPAGVVVFLLLVVAAVPAILSFSVGFAGYGNYLLFVLPPGILLGLVALDRILPRLVNLFAVRVVGPGASPEVMRAASRLTWVADVVVRASLAVAVILAIVFLDFSATIERIGVTVIAITTFFGVLNLIIGAQLAREIDAGGVNLVRQVALAELQDSVNEGIRPRYWPEPPLQLSVDPPDGSVWELQALLFVYYHHLDAGRYSEALDAINRTTEVVQPMHAPLTSDVWHEAGFVAARLHDDPQAARGCIRFLRSSRRETPMHTRHRVEAAILLAEGNTEAAQAEARRGLEAVAESNTTGIARMDRELLIQLLKESGG